MSPLERVVIVDDTWNSRGGASQLAHFLAKQLGDFGLDVVYLTGMKYDADSANASNAIQYVSANCDTQLGDQDWRALREGIWNKKVERTFSEWISEHDSPGTVYHVHSWSQVLSPSVFRVLKKVDPNRVILHAHDLFLVCPNGGYYNFQTQIKCELIPGSWRCLACHCDKRAYIHKLYRNVRHTLIQRELKLYQDRCHFIAIHSHMKHVLQLGGIQESQIRVVPNPVHTLDIGPIDAAQNQEFLYLGRMVSEKGVAQFAQAAAAAGVQVRMVGSGPLEATIREAYPQIQVDGWCDRSRLAEKMKSARCLVLPTLVLEAFGLVVTEALAAGVPILISNNCNLAEDVVSHGVGLMCDPFDHENFVQILTTLSQDDAHIRKMSRRAPEAAFQIGMSEQDWVQEFANLYQAILN